MGKKEQRKFYFRTVLFITFSSFVFIDYLANKNIVNTLIDYKIFNLISILHVLWIYLIVEMLYIIIPPLNRNSYNGKHLIKHYKPIEDYDDEQLKLYTKQNQKKVFLSALFWILLNIPFITLYMLGYIDRTIMYWLFFFYYFADTFCINVFCIFHFALIKSKCCNECRIYNWSYIMYSTPLLFMPSVWNYSVAILSIIIFIWWELAIYFHPERFSSISNQKLQCKHCVHDCRYTKKRNKIEYIIETTLKKIFKPFEKQKNC